MGTKNGTQSSFPMLRSIMFGFVDVAMERKFQNFRVSTLLDQIRPIITIFWIPVAAVVHVGTYAYRSCYLQGMLEEEISIFRVRLALLFLAILLFSREWPQNLKYTIGSWLPCLNRMHVFIIAYEQSNILADDIYSMTTLVASLTMSGLQTCTYVG